MALIPISLKVNGTRFERAVEPRRLLSDFLREDLGLKATHVGCEHGVCGTCTVLMDGEAVRSCLSFAVQADGCEVRTADGLAQGGKLSALQQAFWEKHGLQCGFCTPGMLMVATELLERNAKPTKAEIEEAVSSNLCRCTGYYNIVESVQRAAELMQEGAK
ncbi:MAG TPA: (2Fe-2S)-binding protein [Burkholderiales bacterium]|jgi:carbon-monoxide dehydrogenase small subunit|nr:(2Fe-2S)-binding protein [Burkholderiales bacterium]